MRNMLIALSILLTGPFASAQTGNGLFTIQGKIGMLSSPAKVYVQYTLADKDIIDSAQLNNGIFEIKGIAPEIPVTGTITVNKNGTGRRSRDVQIIFIEEGTITVNAVSDSVSKAVIAGSTSNIAYRKFNESLAPLKAIEVEYSKNKETASAAEQETAEFKNKQFALSAKYNKINNKILAGFIRENPKLHYSLKVVSDMAFWQDYNFLNPLYESLDPAIKSTQNGKAFAAHLARMKNVANGAIAPDFTLPDSTGKQISLSSFRGKYVLVDFWASWCGPCRAENPNLVRSYNKYKGKNFEIIGVSADRPDGKARWLEAIKKDGLPWIHVSDLKHMESEVVKKYAVKGIPANFLIDPMGKVIAKGLRGEDLDHKLEEVLNAK